MIIGNGLIAKALKPFDREDVAFIAAGVSDSSCMVDAEFLRERKLVKKLVTENSDKLIVFFSSFSIYDPVMKNNKYVINKLIIEAYLEEFCPNFLIVRISNLVGLGGNPKNVFNFFYQHLISGEPFTLWANSSRNLIHINDFAIILNYILEEERENFRNKIVDIVNAQSFSVLEIIETLEQVTGLSGHYQLEGIESIPHPADANAIRWFKVLNLPMEDYLNQLTRIYVNQQISKTSTQI